MGFDQLLTGLVRKKWVTTAGCFAKVSWCVFRVSWPQGGELGVPVKSSVSMSPSLLESAFLHDNYCEKLSTIHP